MRTGSLLALLLVAWRLCVEWGSWEPPGFNAGPPSRTAECERCHRRSELVDPDYRRYWCSRHGEFYYCSFCSLHFDQGDATDHSHGAG